MASYQQRNDEPLECVEPLLGGTLCLMTCWSANPSPFMAKKIMQNLHKLSNTHRLSPELRLVCERLLKQWASLREEREEETPVALMSAGHTRH